MFLWFSEIHKKKSKNENREEEIKKQRTNKDINVKGLKTTQK